MSKKRNGKFKRWIRRIKRARAKKGKKIGTMDIVLIVIAMALFAFTVEMIKLFRETGMVPDTLVTCVFAALGGECGIMGWIKTNKDRHRERKYELEDRTHYGNTAVETAITTPTGETEGGNDYADTQCDLQS